MLTDTYPISVETERYVAASIENNKFAIVFAGAPFLSVFLFTSLNIGKISQSVLLGLAIGATCLFAALIYSMARLIGLHRHRAVILSRIAKGESGEITISRSPPWLSVLPGFCLFVGYGASFVAFVILVISK